MSPMSPNEREDFGELRQAVATVESRTSPRLVATYIALIITATFGTVIPFGVYTVKSLARVTTELAILRVHMGLAMADNKADITGTLNKPEPTPPKPPVKAATVAMMEYNR